jgi:hypothetical protein
MPTRILELLQHGLQHGMIDPLYGQESGLQQASNPPYPTVLLTIPFHKARDFRHMHLACQQDRQTQFDQAADLRWTEGHGLTK